MTAKYMCNSFGAKRMLSLAVAVVCGSIAAERSYALPIDGQVVRGDAIIDATSDTTLTITQESDRAVINFEDFSIDENEQVIFIQPGTDSAVLNRVIGNNVSEIYGDISANGQVFLINTNGVIFGEGASINVGSLVTSTYGLSNDAFMNGQLTFNANEQSGSIVNAGNIRSSGAGGVAFIAPVVVNDGVIEAVGGDVQIVSQKSVNNAVFIQQDGSPISQMIEVGVDDGVIENSGIIRAIEIENDGGDVVLIGGTSSDIYNTGLIDVNESVENSAAGNVKIEANRIAMLGEIRANGLQNSGGNIENYAHSVAAIGEESLTQANAGEHGDGGNVVYFSPEITLFRSGGLIEARGGTFSGNGGYVDVSGLQQVEAFGLVNTSATNGFAGEYLIDPYDIVISNVADTQGGWASPFTPTSSGTNINVSTLQTNLQLGSVTINTANGAGADTGNISILNNIDLDGTNGNSLSLIADGSISMAAGVTIEDLNTATSDVVALSFIAGGNVDMQDTSLIDAGDGTISITAGGNANIGGLRSNSISSSAIAINSGSGIFSAGTNYLDADASLGGLSLSAIQTGALNINVNELAVTTQTGDFSISNAQSITLNNFSVQGNVDVATTAGNINLAGNIDFNGANGSSITLDAAVDIFMDPGATVSDSDLGTSDVVALNFIAGDRLFMDDTSFIDAEGGTISVTTGGNFRVGGLRSTSASNSAIQVIAGNDIADAGSTFTDFDVANGRLDLTARGTVPLEITVNELSYNFTGVDADITNAGALTLVGGASAANLSIQTSSGALTIAGDLNYDGSNGSNIVLGAAGDIELQGTASITDLTPATLDNTFVQLTSGGNINLLSGSSISVADESIVLSATGNVSVAGLSSQSSLSNAISINAGGQIIDGGDAVTDIIAQNGGVAFVANGGVGNVSFIETDVGILSADLSGGAGNVRINALGDLGVGTLTNVSDLDLIAINGDVILQDAGVSAAGSVSIRANDVLDDVGRDVNLTAPTLYLEISALASDTTFLTAVDNVDFSIAGAGNITLENSQALQVIDSALDVDSDALQFETGAHTVRTTTGDLTISSDINFDGVNGSTLTLETTGGSGDIIFPAGIQIADKDLLTTDDVNINLNSNSDVRMQGSSIIDASGGLINIVANENLAIGVLRTSNASNTAITMNLGGGVNDPGGADLDIFAPSGGVDITAVTNISDANSLETEIARISLNVGGNVDITEVDDLEIIAVDNAANLIVNASGGTLTIPDAGILIAGDLSLSALDLLDNVDRNIDIAASILNLDVATPAGATQINSTITNANIAFGNALTVTNANGISLDSLDTNSDFSLITNAGDINLTNNIDTDGANGSTWAFDSAANTNITAGVAIEDSNTLTPDDVNFLFTSANLFDARSIGALNSGGGMIGITSGGNTRITSAVTTSNASNAVQINAANILGDGSQATDISALNGGVVLNTSGRITGEIGSYIEINAQVLDVSVQSSGNVIISAPEVRDSDNAITLSALQTILDISAPTQDLVINSDVDALDINFSGSASVTINEASAIELVDLNADTQALAVNDGNLLLLANGDISVSNNVIAQDQSADGLRSGMVSLESVTGNISVGTANDVSITSSNTVDQLVDGGVGNGINGNVASQTGIYLGLQNNTDATRSIALGSDTTAANIVAIGGDIEIDGVGDGSNNVLAASISLSPVSSISAYNDINDALDGSIFLDGNSLSSETNVSVRSNRSVALTGVDFVVPTPTITPTPTVAPTPTAVPTPTPDVVDVSSDEVVAAANDGQESVNESATSTPDAEPTQHSDDAFEFVFGTSSCDDLSEENQSQCKIEASIKAFLSHWTVGGQLPPQKAGM